MALLQSSLDISQRIRIQAIQSNFFELLSSSRTESRPRGEDSSGHLRTHVWSLAEPAFMKFEVICCRPSDVQIGVSNPRTSSTSSLAGWE